MTDTTFKCPALHRAFEDIDIEVRGKDSEPVSIVFSGTSGYKAERVFGDEILDHSAGAIRLERAKRGAIPLLFNHDLNDIIGMVDDVSVDGERTLVRAHFFETERAREVVAMLRGGLRNVSSMYRIFKVQEGKDNVYTVREWEPLEYSIVSVPVDPTVGIGRQITTEEFEVRMLRASEPPAKTAVTTGDTQVSDEQNAAAGTSADDVVLKPTNPVDLERARKDAIHKLCVVNKLDERYERSWIESGADVNKVADDLIKIMNERAAQRPESDAFLDLSKADVRKYSLMRALRAAANNDWTDAGLELECNKEISKRLDRSPKSRAAFFVPLDKVNAISGTTGKRDMTVAGVSGSNYLVGTDNLPGSFIDLLRNTSVALRMGVTKMSGLKGHVTIPKMTAGNTAYWLSDENTAITESQPTLGQLSLTPKNVAALTEVSHQLLTQSTPDAEGILLTSIARDIGLAVDVAVIRGSGSAGQPTGIVNTASIGSVSGTSLGAAGVLEFQSDVAAQNALFPGFGYVTTPAVAALLMARPELPSTGTTRLWTGSMLEGAMFGVPAMSSAQMSSATMLGGWWPSVILAEWGVLELMINPFSDFTRGLSAVRGWYTCDVGVRYAGAWSYASSIT